MKASRGIFATMVMLCLAGFSRADVATSVNYGLTVVSLDGGGQRSAAGPYVNDGAIGTVAGRGVATFSVVNFAGYVAQLNNPPVAADDLRSHPLDVPLDVSTAVFLGNDFDPDGDGLQILSVAGASEAGGTVTLVRGRVQYVAPPGFNGTDHFDYVALDTNGDVDVATVTVVVAPSVEAQPLNTVALFRLPNGKFLVRFKQIANRTEYRIEMATNLEDPDWETLINAPARTDGIVEVIVDFVPNENRFFRAISL